MAVKEQPVYPTGRKEQSAVFAINKPDYHASGAVALAQVFGRAMTKKEIAAEYKALFTGDHCSTFLPENAVLWYDVRDTEERNE